MCFDGPFGSTKRHEIKGSGGETKNGSIKAHEVLGPSKDMRFHEGKHKNGSIKAHEVFGPSNEILYQI